MESEFLAVAVAAVLLVAVFGLTFYSSRSVTDIDANAGTEAFSPTYSSGRPEDLLRYWEEVKTVVHAGARQAGFDMGRAGRIGDNGVVPVDSVSLAKSLNRKGYISRESYDLFLRLRGDVSYLLRHDVRQANPALAHEAQRLCHSLKSELQRG